MNEINKARMELEAGQKRLVPVRDPITIQPASIDIDQELFKLAKNCKTLVSLECIAGIEAVRLEKEYNKSTYDQALEWNEMRLEEVGVVKSNKFKFIKTILGDQYALLEEMRLKHKYFRDMRETYVEWINVYKKTRSYEQRIT